MFLDPTDRHKKNTIPVCRSLHLQFHHVQNQNADVSEVLPTRNNFIPKQTLIRSQLCGQQIFSKVHVVLFLNYFCHLK